MHKSLNVSLTWHCFLLFFLTVIYLLTFPKGHCIGAKNLYKWRIYVANIFKENFWIKCGSLIECDCSESDKCTMSEEGSAQSDDPQKEVS